MSLFKIFLPWYLHVCSGQRPRDGWLARSALEWKTAWTSLLSLILFLANSLVLPRVVAGSAASLPIDFKTRLTLNKRMSDVLILKNLYRLFCSSKKFNLSKLLHSVLICRSILWIVWYAVSGKDSVFHSSGFYPVSFFCFCFFCIYVFFCFEKVVQKIGFFRRY